MCQVTFERKAPFATTSFIKGGWACFQGLAYFREITVPSYAKKKYTGVVTPQLNLSMWLLSDVLTR